MRRSVAVGLIVVKRALANRPVMRWLTSIRYVRAACSCLAGCTYSVRVAESHTSRSTRTRVPPFAIRSVMPACALRRLTLRSKRIAIRGSTSKPSSWLASR
jgi:hypothetical protein